MKRNAFLRDFGTLLRQARLRAGLSQEALAARARMHQVTLSALETGSRSPRLTTVEQLARALALEAKDLVPRLRR